MLPFAHLGKRQKPLVEYIIAGNLSTRCSLLYVSRKESLVPTHRSTALGSLTKSIGKPVPGKTLKLRRPEVKTAKAESGRLYHVTRKPQQVKWKI